MSKRTLAIIIFVVILLIPSISSAIGDRKDIIIKYKDQKNSRELLKEYGLKSNQVEDIPELKTFKLRNASWLQKIQIDLDKYFSGEIEYVEENEKYQLFSVPNDPEYNNQWALPKISAPSAWDITTGINDIKVAILDTGINGNHEDLQGKITEGYNVITDSVITANDNSDDHGHGTMIAGVIGAIANNNKGIAGIDWNADIMPIKVLDQDGLGYSFDIATGIIYAADHGAKIINLSLGGRTYSETLKNAIDYAHDQKGVLVIAASGNDNSSISYPAKFDHVLAVGATNQQDDRWYKSNFGPELDVVAPGSNILTSTKNGSYAYVTGTSLAAPNVAGLAALVWSSNTLYSNDQVESFVENNTDKVIGMNGSDFSDYYGYGRINAYKSLVSQGEYKANKVSQNSSPSIMAGQSYNFLIKFKNTGTVTWGKENIHLATAEPNDRTTPFLKNNNPGYSTWQGNGRLDMVEDSVAPGEIATFSFWMQSPANMNPGTYSEYFKLIGDEDIWMDDTKINWDVKVLSKIEANFSSRVMTQSNYPIIGNGESKTLTISYLNTSNLVWHRGIVNLGLVDKDYKWKSGGYDLMGDWVSSDRPAYLDQDVNPGEVGTFTFNIKNNNADEGNHRIDVGMVADGIKWFSIDSHAYWDVFVPRKYQAQYIRQSNFPVIGDGQIVEMSISYLNNGSETWRKGRVNLGLVDKDFRWRFDSYDLAYNWLSNNRAATLDQDMVAPGEIGTFTFRIKNNDAGSGNHRLDVGLVADGIAWFQDNTHAYWDVTVPTKFNAELVSQSGYVSIGNAETRTLSISYRNTGSSTWRKGVVNLGTVDTNYNWRLDDYALNNNWRSGNRPARLDQDTVAPGEIGTFTFTIKNNGLTKGNYRLDVGLVADGITWFPINTHAYWDVLAQ